MNIVTLDWKSSDGSPYKRSLTVGVRNGAIALRRVVRISPYDAQVRKKWCTLSTSPQWHSGESTMFFLE